MDIRALIYHCIVIKYVRVHKTCREHSDGHSGLLVSDQDTVTALSSNMRLQDGADESSSASCLELENTYVYKSLILHMQEI